MFANIMYTIAKIIGELNEQILITKQGFYVIFIKVVLSNTITGPYFVTVKW